MKHRCKSIARISLAVLCLAAAAPAMSAERDRSPNIVLLLADDMGYGDPACQNTAAKIPTPNLDALAAEGMRFTDAHTPSSVCTPTRYGILTGRYCWRSRLKRGVLFGFSPPLIDGRRMTLAALLKKHGYHTGVVGKWHLGLGWAKVSKGKGSVDYSRKVGGGPDELGFDFSYIIPASLDMPPYVYVRNGKVVERPALTQKAQPFPAYVRKGVRAKGFELENVLDHLADQAIGYVRERARTKKPFFLYFPFSAPHKPVLPHPRFRGKTRYGPYGDFIVQVDATVGRVLDAIRDAGAADETLVFFTSDNGSFMFRLEGKDAKDHVDDSSIQAFRVGHHQPNSILRGTKADIWEAGHRVPFLARWPGKIRPQTRCDATICLTDLFATCAAIVGAELPRDAAEDSFSFLPLLEGKPQQWSRAPVVHHSIRGMFSIRKGRWKLVLGNGSGGRERPAGKPFAKPYTLFDMKADICERHDVIGEHPDIARRLEAELQEIRSKGRSRP